MRGNPFELSDEPGVSLLVDRFMDHPLAGWEALQIVAVPAVLTGPDRTALEATTAVRADLLQHYLDTILAKGALETAHPSLAGIGRQRLVAVLTGGPELEHGISMDNGGVSSSALYRWRSTPQISRMQAGSC
jgi:hypothetical protein